MPDLSHFLETLEPWIAAYGAPVVFVVLTLESFGMPLPGESILVFAAILAGRGQLSFPALLAAAWAGAVLGDNIGYGIGRSLGNTLIDKFGGRVGLTPARIAYVEGVFAKYGALTVAFARFVNVLRQLNGIVAGTLEMRWWTFAAFNALGGALWVAVWATAGFYFGAHGAELTDFARRFGGVGAAIGAVAVVVAVIVMLRRRRKR